MSSIRINSVTVGNYRSFGTPQTFRFPVKDYNKPVAIVGPNNAGKTNLMNSILYGIGYKWVNEQTFEIKDFHNCDWNNIPSIMSDITASIEGKNKWNKDITMNGIKSLTIDVEKNEIIDCSIEPSFYGAQKKYSIFYINFHQIKEEINTQKTSWGNLKSFLAKHIKKLIESDEMLIAQKDEFEKGLKRSTKAALKGSKLDKFTSRIKDHYTKNLRDNHCEVEFGLPNYEDIFLQMIFKVGLNKNIPDLLPISHFGDGYISMFVMAVIQAIGETNEDDKCLFLFEEPESFLHENHQEYFYKKVLCGLSEKGHQVIYTTHSDRMVDLFDTKGLIRIEFDEATCQTVKKYNDTGEFTINEQSSNEGLLTLNQYNQYIKAIEPNLNRILFSKKVLLVEGPNDVMAYKYAIEKKIKNKSKDSKFSETYLNFHNISIVPHHGKTTALLLIELCKHLNLEFFVIADGDLVEDVDLSIFNTLEELHNSDEYITSDKNRKSCLTNNFKLLTCTGSINIHFNRPKLEGVLGYDLAKSEQSSLEFKLKGDSVFLWTKLHEFEDFPVQFFPEALEKFLEIDKIDISSLEIPAGQTVDSEFDDIPF